MKQQTESPLIMMVAQAPFETPDLNQFCKLIPVAYLDGSQPSKHDFPNDGEIWWMLTASSSRLAVPGQLVVGSIERAVKYDADDAESSCYQAVRESIQDLGMEDGLEIIEIATHTINDIQEVVARGFRLQLAVPPAHLVMLRWRSNYYGPFVVTTAPSLSPQALKEYFFSPAQANEMTIYEVDQKTFDETTNSYRIVVEEQVSLTDKNRSRAYELEEARHDLVFAYGYERVLITKPRKLVLEPIDRKLLRFAKNCLTRSKRKQLTQLLDEIEINGREAEDARDLIETIAQAKSLADKQETALSTVAEALLKSGLLCHCS